MLFNKHSELAGRHAFLSASKYHWSQYDDEKLDRVYVATMAAQRGTEIHDFAHQAIRLGIKMPQSRKTLHMYVNDALGYRMTPEQTLYYSENSFGTADTISYRRNLLRIHDLKTGVTLTSERQLEIYAALFCLEYRIKPFEITTELRIYQNDDVRVYDADPDVIAHIMDKIVSFDKRITAIRLQMMS
jgi:hypothetical protein